MGRRQSSTSLSVNETNNLLKDSMSLYRHKEILLDFEQTKCSCTAHELQAAAAVASRLA